MRENGNAAGDVGWTIVRPRRKSNGNHEQPIQHRGGGGQQAQWRGSGDGIVSFYFTNFPSTYDTGALWGLFKKWGNVVDVFVPRKINREGKAFGLLGSKK